MFFMVICKDRPGALETRLATRQAHLDYVAETGVVVQGGPFLNAEGQMCGSLIQIDVADRAAAEAWAAGDPYARAGLFETVEILQWKKVLG